MAVRLMDYSNHRPPNGNYNLGMEGIEVMDDMKDTKKMEEKDEPHFNSGIQMDWQTETTYKDPDSKEFLKYTSNAIMRKIAPLRCFRNKIEREAYFLKSNEYYNIHNLSADKLLFKIALDCYRQPYCFICRVDLPLHRLYNNLNGTSKLLKNKEAIIEHEHDDSRKKGPSIPGRFRAQTCISCNTFEGNARTYKTKQEKMKYWYDSIMNKYNNNIELAILVLQNLEKYGYFINTF